jgi:hypothetical protein
LSTVATGQGLASPLALVLNPTGYTSTGAVPLVFFVANSSGGLIALNASFYQDTSATFPPPTGANNFVALTLTY